ncbi:MAG: hypothetical protein RLZZ546_1736 [Bacteroidota bacterium]
MTESKSKDSNEEIYLSARNVDKPVEAALLEMEKTINENHSLPVLPYKNHVIKVCNLEIEILPNGNLKGDKYNPSYQTILNKIKCLLAQVNLTNKKLKLADIILLQKLANKAKIKVYIVVGEPDVQHTPTNLLVLPSNTTLRGDAGTCANELANRSAPAEVSAMASYNLNRFNPQHTYFDNISTIISYSSMLPWYDYNSNDLTNSNSDFITDYNNWRFVCGSEACNAEACNPRWFTENTNFEEIPTSEFNEMICLQANELNNYRDRIESLMPNFILNVGNGKTFISANLFTDYVLCGGFAPFWRGDLVIGNKKTRTISQTDLPSPSPNTNCNCIE